MTALYDLMLLIDSSAPDERRQEILGNVDTLLRNGGTVVGSHDWGSRKMTFEIDHHPEAAYHLIQFEGGKDLLEQLNQSLRILDDVLRFRIIRQLPGAPPPPVGPEPVRGDATDEPDGRVAARAAADAAPESADADSE